jgi:hypothetical protein
MATAKIGINIDLSDLGGGIQPRKHIWEDSTAPETAVHIPSMQQETADVAEVVPIGSIDDVDGIWIRAIENDVLVDTSFVSTFNSEIIIKEGTSQFFCPSGTVYFKNSVAAELVTIELICYGEQD